MFHRTIFLFSLIQTGLCLGYELKFEAKNEIKAQQLCLNLLGGDARLAQVVEKERVLNTKEGKKFIRYVAVTCQNRDLEPAPAAQKLAEAVSDREVETTAIALRELKELNIRTPRILEVLISEGLDIDHVPNFRNLADFLAGYDKDLPTLLKPLLQDKDAERRYKVTYILYLNSIIGKPESLKELLPDLEKLYASERYAKGDRDDSPLGTKINIVRIAGNLAAATPTSLMDKIWVDLEDVQLSSFRPDLVYEGPLNLGSVATKAFAQMGKRVVPSLSAILKKHRGGPFLNQDSVPLSIAEALGTEGKDLIPVLEQILADGNSPLPQRVEETLKLLKAAN